MLKALLAQRNLWHHWAPVHQNDIPLVTLRKLAGTLALALALPSTPALAGTDYSDLWWNAAESGWGAGITRQDDVVFLTLFVYGADGNGTWFVAPDMTAQGGDTSWSGTLFRAAGPGFAAAFDGNVQTTSVGTASLDFSSATAGTLRYVVDGTQVTKQITRMTWRAPSPNGRYYGGFSAVIPQCGDPTRLGGYDFLGSLNVAQNGANATFSVTSSNAGLNSTCNFSGPIHQDGRHASVAGNFACTIVIGLDTRGEATQTTSRRGTFTMSRISVTQNGFHGDLTAADQDCAFAGYFGGTRLP